MSLCPLLNFKPPRSVLKDKTNTSHHPWEKTIKSVHYNKINNAHNSINNPVYPKPKQDVKSERIQFTVFGIRTCKEFIYCANLVKGMHKYRWKTFDVPIIKGVLPPEWPSAWNDLKILHGGSIYCITTPVIILLNGEFFGGDKELKEFMESKYIYRICLDYRKEAMEKFSTYVKSTGRPFVYMHISIDENYTGTLIFMLYSNIVPNTCENFLRLCKTRRGGYSGTPVHRIVKDGWIQCGGFSLKDTNLGCENFAVSHNRRGVLSMCNDGREVNCSTQFFVLLQPSNWMDHKYVAFGQLVDGEQTLKKIENEPTFYEAPTSSIIIDKAGILNLDCEDITINKRVREYLNKHIEDLIEREEFLIELIMQRVWAAIEARQIESEQSEEEQLENSESSVGSYLHHPNSKISVSITHNTGENKENQQFAADSYTMYESEKSHYDGIKVPVYNSANMVTQTSNNGNKPFYIPLTDVSYPEEVDSTFDLKRFLQGDYCLESDLQKNLSKDEREILKISYSNLPSDMFLFDEDEYTHPDSAEIDSSEEEEIKSYIKNNVDRVSFAGEVIKNIGLVHRGHAMFNLFEGKRKSELPVVTDDDLKRLNRVSVLERRQSRRQSETPNFTDEDIRKLRGVSAIAQRKTILFDRRQSMKRASMPSEPVELPKLSNADVDDTHKRSEAIPRFSEETKKRLRRASQAVFGLVSSEDRYSMTSQTSQISKESYESQELPKLVDPEMSKKMQRKSTFDKRRQSIFDPHRFRSESPDHIQGLRKSQIDKIRRISMFDANENPKTDMPRVSSTKGSFDKKRRQTVFAKDIAQVQRYQKDAPSDESSSSSLDVAQPKIIRFPSGTKETHRDIKRRQTGYIHEKDLDKLILEGDEQLNDSVVDEKDDENIELNIVKEGAIKLAIPVKEVDPQTIERRQTGFIRPTPSLLEEIKDIPIARDSTTESTQGIESESISDTTILISDMKLTDHLGSMDQNDQMQNIHETNPWEKEESVKKKHSKSSKALDNNEMSKIAHLRESVFLRRYEDSMLPDRTASPPTLKNYKPMSEIIPNAKNMFLTFGKGIHFDSDHRSPLLRRSKNIDSEFSFMTMSGIKFGRKMSPVITRALNDQNLVTEREKLLMPRCLKSLGKHSKRPLISVQEYQKKNQERLEKIKRKEDAAGGDKQYFVTYWNRKIYQNNVCHRMQHLKHICQDRSILTK